MQTEIERSKSIGSTIRENGLILILEDEALIALDLEYILMTEGYSVEICSSCEDALQWLRTNTPSVALLDIELVDGPSTQIAQRLDSKGVPFIVCSGRDQTGAPEIFLKNRWLSKPCAPELIVKSVTNALSVSSSKS